MVQLLCVILSGCIHDYELVRTHRTEQHEEWTPMPAMGIKRVSEVSESRSVESDPLRPHGLYSPWNSLGQNTGVDSLSLLQGIFPTQGSNSGLPHSREILYQLSHRGSPNILEWVSPVLSPWDLPDPGIEPGLLHCRRILYQLSYQGSPHLLRNGLKYQNVFFCEM